MKRIGAFSLAIFIFVLSVFSVIPVYADGDKTVLPCNLKQTMAFSSSDAQAYVAAHIHKTAIFFLLTLLQLLIIGIYVKMAN
mgnify:CR=1 FL=1